MKFLGNVVFGLLLFGLAIEIAKVAKNYFILHWPWFALVGIVVITIIIAIIVNTRSKVNASRRETTAQEARRLAEEAQQRQREKDKDEEQQKQEKNHYQRQQKTESEKSSPRDNWSVGSRKDALEVLDLKEPFTQDELKKRWRAMLKQTHPDQGGSNMVLRLVNEAYQYLKK